MNATTANLINSISLITVGLWGYFDVLSPTALIPVLIGVFLDGYYRILRRDKNTGEILASTKIHVC